MNINEVTDLFEMSNIRKTESGLPVNIYVSSGGSVNKQYGPRIKVMTTKSARFDPSKTVSVILKKDITADDVIGYDQLPANVLNPIRDYINLNYATLMQYWNDKISTAQLISKLKPLLK